MRLTTVWRTVLIYCLSFWLMAGCSARWAFAGTGEFNIPVNNAIISGDWVTTDKGAEIQLVPHPAVLFDASQTEEALYLVHCPDNYSSGLAITLYFSMATDVTNKVDWEIYVMAYTVGTDTSDIDTADFDTVNEVTGGTTVPTTTAGKPGKVTITLTNNDSIQAGDLFWVLVKRDHDDADDTAANDAELRDLLHFTYTY